MGKHGQIWMDKSKYRDAYKHALTLSSTYEQVLSVLTFAHSHVSQLSEEEES